MLVRFVGVFGSYDIPAAPAKGTVLFTAPLYRKNLHYSVVSKPSAADHVIKMMKDYIQQNHKDQSGIIYCLSKKVGAALMSCCDHAETYRVISGC